MSDLGEVAGFLASIGFGTDWHVDTQFVAVPRCLREPLAEAYRRQASFPGGEASPMGEEYVSMLDENIRWTEPPTYAEGIDRYFNRGREDVDS